MPGNRKDKRNQADRVSDELATLRDSVDADRMEQLRRASLEGWRCSSPIEVGRYVQPLMRNVAMSIRLRAECAVVAMMTYIVEVEQGGFRLDPDR